MHDADATLLAKVAIHARPTTIILAIFVLSLVGRPVVDAQFFFERRVERNEAFAAEDGGGAEGGGRLLLALRAVAVVEGFGLVAGGLEVNSSALAADVHCED